MTPDEVARIVDRRGDPAFVALLREADAEFVDSAFEPALVDALRAEPRLVRLWDLFSGDQRWSPSAYVEGVETGWYDAGYRNVRTHPDQAAAVGDFIHRMATWLARREVLYADQ
jgi:hypothetical protein